MPGIHESKIKLFITAEETVEPEKAEIIGKLPPFVSGTFLRVGPSKFDFENDFSVNYWLDGYALLSSFKITQDSVVFTKRYLQSDAYKRSLAASRPVIDEYGTKGQADPNKGFLSRVISSIMPEMTDNNYSTLCKIGSDVFAFSDTCYFRQIDTQCLDAGEKYDSNKHFGSNCLCAHPLVDENGDTWSIGLSLFPNIKYHIIRMPKKSTSKDMVKKGESLASVSTRWRGSIATVHSFGMSPNYVIFVEQPFVIVAARLLSSVVRGDTVKDWCEWKPQDKNRFCIFCKRTGKFLKTEFISKESFYYLHFVNCYEENDQIILDILVYDSPSALDTMNLSNLRDGVYPKSDLPHLQRFVIPLSVNRKANVENDVNLLTLPYTKATAIKKGNVFVLSPETITESGMEMPIVNPNFRFKKYSYAYTAGTFCPSTFVNCICKVDTIKKETIVWKNENDGENLYPGEPMFVANPNGQDEDDGVLISAVTDRRMDKQDFLLFLNANSLTEIGRVYFKSHVPSAMHGLFLKN